MKTARAITTLLLAVAFSIPAVEFSVARTEVCLAVSVPGLENACRRPDGVLKVFSRTGEFLGLTHGPDSAQPTAAGPTDDGSAASTTGQRPPVCADSSDYRVELIYARAFDDTDQYSTRAPWLLAEFEHANWLLNKTAVETGAASADYKVACSDGAPTIHSLVLPTSLSEDTFNSVMRDVRAAGHSKAKTKHLVFYDQNIVAGTGGIANMPYDDRLIPDNGALTGGMLAVMTSMTYWTLMHELSHTMGAVQGSAPHTSGNAHCTDGYDIMCYADGGRNANQYSETSCPSFRAFDCNNDDYFHANPKSDSYLGTHWNLGSRYNKYIRFSPDSSTPAPTPTPSSSAAPSPAPSSTPAPTPTQTQSASPTPTPAPTPTSTPTSSSTPSPTQSPTPTPDRTAPALSIIEPRAGVRYDGGCSGTRGKSPSSSRPAYGGGKGCVQANVSDSGSGVRKFQVYFDGRLVWTIWSFPMSPLTFNLGRGRGTKIPLRLVATDHAGNQTSKTIYVDVV